jgi:hypothetical protein
VLGKLPVEKYPQVAPPQITMYVTYPGASATTLNESVVSLIEEELNGAKGLMYYESTSNSNGLADITVTFAPGTDPDFAQVDVQNRLAKAESRLPQIVKDQGIEVEQANAGFLAVHSNGKIGVLVEFGAPENLDSSDFEELGKDVAMQIAALSPVCVCEEEVPAELVEKEKEIYKSQAMEEGKPEHIAEKIVEGRIKKYYKEICLVDQPFVKDDKQCVGDLLKNFGPDVTIRRFVRMELGAQAN